jgi:hypothetical protein
MRTPYRLAASLLKFRLAQALPGVKEKLPLRRIVVADAAHAAAHGKISTHTGDSTAIGKHAKASVAPVLWLAGAADPASANTLLADTLSNPAIGNLTRQFRKAGRTVFLETDGTQLRRRIHEFRPDARLYLTLRLYGAPHTHDRRMKRDGAFAFAMEGIRAAQLSGFLICAHVVVEGDTELHEINRLMEQLGAVNFDGMIITAGNDAAKTQRETAIVARTLIENRWWASFSRLVQFSFDAPDGKVLPASISPRPAAAQIPANPVVRDSRDAAVSSEKVAIQ